MNLDLGPYVLRRLKDEDAEALLLQKNDPEVTDSLVGLDRQFTRQGISEWIAYHMDSTDEEFWAIARKNDDACLGHAALYELNQVVRSAEFGILIGAKDQWGRGLGGRVTREVLRYAFEQLELNRISLEVLDDNEPALRIYRRLGFRKEGLLRQAAFKKGRLRDVVVMSILRGEFGDAP